ncbi:MAG: hypothetical protein IPH07_22020 [Deltaproteobacteria bacterium]|nr:hypothetical protein [Deltaproteobacteria bacterium]
MPASLACVPLLAAAWLFAPAKGDAAPGVRFDRPSTSVKPRTTLQTQVTAAKQAATKAAGERPSLTAQAWARERVATEHAILDAQITKLERLASVTEKGDPELPELLMRLADLQLEKRAYFEQQAGALYEPIHDAKLARKKAEAERLTALQRRHEKSARAASTRAVEIYRALVDDRAFAKYPKLDEAIYFYAFELGQLEREPEMKDAYARLVRDFPDSRYVASAYLAFGDHYFGKNAIAEAIKFYQRVVDGYPDHPAFAYAQYKLAWCHLNPIGSADPDYGKSLDGFVRTIAATLEGRAGSEANAKHLRRDARRDLVRAYVHAGRPSKAWEFFGKVGNGPKPAEDAARTMMELLANAYFGEGMYVESTAIYRQLQDAHPGDASDCAWQAQIVVNALATDDKAIQWAESERLAKTWESLAQGKPAETVRRKCAADTRDTLRQMATVWHDEADKTHKPETFAYAAKAYREFLRVFPKHADAYELGYFLGELLWLQAAQEAGAPDAASRKRSRESFLAAHDAFMDTLARRPDGKHTKVAAYAQMLAMKNHLAYDETGSKGIGCTVDTEGVCVPTARGGRGRTRTAAAPTAGIDVATAYPATDYSGDEAKMIASYDAYERYVGDVDDAELPKILYHRLKLAMDHNRFEEAEPHARALVQRFDGTVYAAWAAEMLTDRLTLAWQDRANDAEQSVAARAALEAWTTELQRSRSWKHEAADRLRTQVPTLVAAVRGQRAEAARQRGVAGDREGYVECADTYLSVYNEFESHPRADALLFNAARCLEAAQRVGHAVKLRKELLASFPASPLFRQTLRELGENYHAIAFYDDAAQRYEQYAEKFPEDAFAPDALRNAYLFRLGRGDDDAAKSDLDRYESIYRAKDPMMAAKIFWSKHALVGDAEQRLAHARAYLAQYGSKGGVDRAVVAEAAAGQILWRQSCSKELSFDSCIGVRRRRATTGETQRRKAEAFRSRVASRRGDGGQSFCGTETQAIITVHARDPKLVAAAQKHLARALELARKAKPPEDDSARVEAFHNAVGLAMVYTADADYERYLALEIPGDLWFGAEQQAWKRGQPGKLGRQYEAALARETKARKSFSEYFARKVELGRVLLERYGKVADSGSKHWTLAAAARAALVHRNFADQLYRAPIPENLRRAEEREAYCDALAEQADPELGAAAEALRYCLARSTEYAFFNEFSRMCEEELQQSDANAFPATNEAFARASFTAVVMDRVGVQLHVE